MSIRKLIRNGLFLFSILTLDFFMSDARGQEKDGSNGYWGDWQVSLGFGTQMSGIKDEDFVASNYSPLLNVSFGKWFSPALALEIGYRGWYFNTISDDEKRRYGYYHGSAVLNVKALLRGYDENGIWFPWLHAGSGYFYNHYYGRPNICADFGISNNFRITEKLSAGLEISALVGWDIYQGDEDVLPGLAVAVRYLF